MVNKRLPDWLNSSLWSSTPSLEDDERLSRHSTTTTTTISYSPAVEPTLDPPTPPTPPSPTRVDPEKPPETKDSPSNDSHSSDLSYNDISEEVDFSTVDISRQSQLLAELLLGYLPPDRGLWSSELAKRRLQYKQFKEELLMNPSEITWRLDKTRSCDKGDSKSESRGLLSRSEITHGEHPLSLGKTSIWNQFFQDTEIIEQIDRDVKRTHPGMHFFSGDSQFAECNQEALKNILIIFAKLNPGIKYVQGMNEILAPLFYIFRNDPEEEYAASAEADTFFCFVELLSGFRDHFCQQLDNSVVGIRSTITKLSQLLKEHDEELWRHLEVTTKVNPQFYAFRWITLLLTQEFNFSDSLHIWDTLLSDPEGPQETLLRICCAMLILIRRRLLAGDFTSNLKLLQNYPPTNISHLLYVANTLRVQSIG
ncbi:TBC1 domain family member 13-like isoform X2 [Juglans microcarpa x Juglans regia]|uniref:TBC1 domain family member 13-like isoform X2 n=1 Tax=Juglans microcarpa x Juglans regia TaxID=2249226 RepID=UPI001B7E2F68|nr:TBC1 domain family member 13-like isoform X2 [Juglans microcarpa x Juglans regia]